MSQEAKYDIMIVDDQQANLKVLSAILRHHHYRVRPAISGMMAIKAAKMQPPDLILLDILMPEMNGYETARSLAEDPATADVPIIFISALDDLQNKMLAFESGGVDYIAKPFYEDEVIARVKTHLSLRDAQLTLYAQNQQLIAEVVERRRAEEALQANNQKLAQTLDNLQAMEGQIIRQGRLVAVGQLAAGVAHEINTPTQYIQDNVDFLETGFHKVIELLQKIAGNNTNFPAGTPPDNLQQLYHEAKIEFLMAEIPRSIAEIQHGIGQISKIVQAMREFSHPGTTEKEDVDINKVLERTIVVSRNEWKYKATLHKNLAAELPLVRGTSNELGQVFLNIMVNAAQAIKTHLADDDSATGNIHLTSSADEEWVTVEVKDTGGGIPPDIQAKIFDPFFTTKPPGLGTGQGLAIAHAIVVEHNGTITFESVPGESTRFIIKLPVITASYVPTPGVEDATDETTLFFA